MRGKRKWVSGMTDFVFLLPAFVLFTAVIAIPFIQAVGIAFTNWDGLSKTYQFNGLTNLTALFKDAQTANAVKNTLLYTIATCVGVNVLALAITVGLNANIRGARFLKSVMFAPIIASLVITAFIWGRIYGDVFPINFGMPTPLTNTKTVVLGIAAMCLWRDTGLAMVIYNAGLQSVPEELKEAARVDGANAWQTFWRVTFPMLAPAVTTCVTLWLGYGLKVFDYPKVATNGGPGKASETFCIFVYNHFFTNNRAGYGQMAALVMLIAVVIMTSAVTKILRKREVQM